MPVIIYHLLCACDSSNAPTNYQVLHICRIDLTDPGLTPLPLGFDDHLPCVLNFDPHVAGDEMESSLPEVYRPIPSKIVQATSRALEIEVSGPPTIS